MLNVSFYFVSLTFVARFSFLLFFISYFIKRFRLLRIQAEKSVFHDFLSRVSESCTRDYWPSLFFHQSFTWPELFEAFRPGERGNISREKKTERREIVSLRRTGLDWTGLDWTQQIPSLFYNLMILRASPTETDGRIWKPNKIMIPTHISFTSSPGPSNLLLRW